MGAVVVGGAGVVSYAMADPGTEAAPAAAYRAAAVHTLSLETKADRKVVPQKSTKPFNAVSVTWKDTKDELDGTAQFRARNAESGAWGAWTTLPEETNDADGAERKGTDIRGGTTSVSTSAASNGVEVRVVDADGKASGLPSGMDVKLIDPGTGTRKGAPRPPRSPPTRRRPRPAPRPS